MNKNLTMKILDLEDFFENCDNQVVKVDKCTIIEDFDAFWRTHIQYLKRNKGNKLFLPYYDRLLTVYKILNNGNKSKTSI